MFAINGAPVSDDSSSSDEMNTERDNAPPPSGGYRFELVDEVNRVKFTCYVCHWIIRNLIELPCEHRGCKSCIEGSENKKSR